MTDNSSGGFAELNPLIRKGIRERLRLKQLIAWGLLTLILTSFTYLTAYLEGSDGQWIYDEESESWEKGEASPVNGARRAFPWLLGVQGFILMFLGTGRMAGGTAEERETGLLDYQRMTPMRPFSKIIGYLFGLPAREYFMFTLTLPFLVHAIIVGELTPGKVFHLYAVFLSCVLLYHLTAHVTGLIVSKPRAASWVSRMVVLGLYVFLPGLGQAGFSFLSFLTLLPTYFGLMSEELLIVGEQSRNMWNQEMATFWTEVPFFETTLSPAFFTVLMQGLLLSGLFATAHRKWRNEALTAFSKPFGIGLFFLLQFMLLGSLWQLYGDGNASGLLGTAISGDKFDESLIQETESGIVRATVRRTGVVVVIVQTILFTLSLAAAVLILNVTCPTRHQYLKGKRRSAKLGLTDIPMWADEKPGWLMVLCLALIMPFTHFALLTRAINSGLYFENFPGMGAYILPCVLFAACLAYVRAAREKWFSVGFWGFLGLLWITPLLTCMVLAVGWEEKSFDFIFHLGSLSPPFAFFEIAARSHDMSLDTHEDALRQGALVGTFVACAIAIWLSLGQFLRRKEWDKREKNIAVTREP
jgi:hypothetical protein